MVNTKNKNLSDKASQTKERQSRPSPDNKRRNAKDQVKETSLLVTKTLSMASQRMHGKRQLPHRLQATTAPAKFSPTFFSS
mmetsp:Transcript_39533/g.59139  ORF Transcript_39533/g.59139 Transcript_39533/m.59139 type:complete len:81 (-) Transcript_39533:7-249(-)